MRLDYSIDKEGIVEYDFMHNSDESLALDFYEAAIQKIAEYFGPERQFEYYSLIRYGLVAIPFPLFKSLSAIWLKTVGGSQLSQNTEELSSRIVAAITGEHGGQKVLGISHSQGGMFLNAAYQQAVARGGEKFDPKLFSALQIATPAGGLTSQGVYRTWINDMITKVPGSLSANVFDWIPSTDFSVLDLFSKRFWEEFLGHGLLEIYLAELDLKYSPLKQRVIEGIQEAALMLGPNCRSCIDPATNKEQVGDYHTNPDGSKGGFVAKTAQVDPSSYVDEDAMVCDNARVYDCSDIWGESEIRGNAVVARYSSVGNSVLAGSTVVYNCVNINSSHLEGKVTFQGEANAPAAWSAYAGAITLPAEYGNGPRIEGQAQLYLANLSDQVTIRGDAHGSGVVLIKSALHSDFSGAFISVSGNAYMVNSFGRSNFGLSGQARVIHSLINGPESAFFASGSSVVRDVDAWNSSLSIPGGTLSNAYFVSFGPVTGSSFSDQVCALWIDTPNHCDSGPSAHGGAYLSDMSVLPSGWVGSIPAIPPLAPIDPSGVVLP